MASGWVRSLQCKSKAYDDVYHPKPITFIPIPGCRKASRSISDVAVLVHQRHKKRQHHRRQRPISPPASPMPRCSSGMSSPSTPSTTFSPTLFPTLAELPPKHSSRNVVEIIFHTSWLAAAPQPKVEMMFKVQNTATTAARFEEYRDAVRSRAAGGDARCLADGNEVMRFHCVGGAGGSVSSGEMYAFAGKGAAVRTFAGSGGAHKNAGGGKGRRAMVVCRVIAGRVCGGVESFLEGAGVGGFDSVSGENESLVVFDSRALLPCFLIIYKV